MQRYTNVPQTKNNGEYFSDQLDSFDYVEFSGELVKAGNVRIEMYGREKIEKAVLYAKDLKDRYSVLWMNYDFLET